MKALECNGPKRIVCTRATSVREFVRESLFRLGPMHFFPENSADSSESLFYGEDVIYGGKIEARRGGGIVRRYVLSRRN